MGFELTTDRCPTSTSQKRYPLPTCQLLLILFSVLCEQIEYIA